jgi:hypothetical protein
MSELLSPRDVLEEFGTAESNPGDHWGSGFTEVIENALWLPGVICC